MRGLSFSSLAGYRGNRGILSLENGYLNFSSRSGLLGNRDYVIQSIPIGAIRSMHAQNSNRMFLGKQTSALVIIVDTSKMPGISRHEFQVDAPEQWITAIQSDMTIQSAETTHPPQPTFVKEVVREIVKYPCPYCNALIEVTSSHCPFCGAPQRK